MRPPARNGPPHGDGATPSNASRHALGHAVRVLPSPGTSARCRRLIPVGGFDLVIFDCDGVLVDSERLVVRVEAEIVTGLGWSLTESDIVERFVGRSAAYMHRRSSGIWAGASTGTRVRGSLPGGVSRRSLEPVPGIIDALREITLPTCVASSGSHDRIRFTLGKTGLLERFRGRSSVSTTSESASRLRTSSSTPPRRWGPHRHGVRSSRTAPPASTPDWRPDDGVRILRRVTSADSLSIGGSLLFDDMAELPALLASEESTSARRGAGGQGRRFAKKTSP